MAEADIVVHPMAVKCPLCGANPQMYCRKENGETSPWVHTGRRLLARRGEQELKVKR